MPVAASEMGRAAAGCRGAEDQGKQATPQELIEFLAPQFAKWWLPDAVEFASEIPRTSAGKFLKSALREISALRRLLRHGRPEQQAPEASAQSP